MPLSILTHEQRGQDAAGIAVCQGGRVYQCKGNGMAAKVFGDGQCLQQLPGYMGIGHLRYPTAGTSSASVLLPGLYFEVSLTELENIGLKRSPSTSTRHLDSP